MLGKAHPKPFAQTRNRKPERIGGEGRTLVNLKSCASTRNKALNARQRNRATENPRDAETDRQTERQTSLLAACLPACLPAVCWLLLAACCLLPACCLLSAACCPLVCVCCVLGHVRTCSTSSQPDVCNNRRNPIDAPTNEATPVHIACTCSASSQPTMCRRRRKRINRPSRRPDRQYHNQANEDTML